MTEPLPEPEMNVQPAEIVESRPPASGEPPAALPPALGDLAREVRRLGRELFKLNRGTEQNQALFETALEELRMLTERLAQVPDLREETAFQAKAQLCRELFHLAD